MADFLLLNNNSSSSGNSKCPSRYSFPETYVQVNGSTALYACTGTMLAFQLLLLAILAVSLYRKCHHSQVPQLLTVCSLFSAVALLCLLMVIFPMSTEFLFSSYRVYEAIIIYRFIELQMKWFGGEKQLMTLLGEGQTMRFNLPPCCCCLLCFMKVTITRNKLKFVRFTVNQMIYVQPFILFISTVLNESGYHLHGMNPYSPLTYLKIAGKVSFLSGFYGLFWFYKLQTTFQILERTKYNQKFAVIKIMFICLALQEAILEGLVNSRKINCFSPYLSAKAYASIIQCGLLLVESTILGIWSFILFLRYPNAMVKNKIASNGVETVNTWNVESNPNHRSSSSATTINL